MTTNDVRDILNIKTNIEPKPSKKAPKQRGQQNDALSKEVVALIGERVPPVVLQSSDHYKKRFTVNRNAQPWEWKAFDNPCRKDGLKLKHWVKKQTQPATASTQPGTNAQDSNSAQDNYYFAKYNYTCAVPTYTDAQYEEHLQSKDWTKEETDYLFSLARDYDLRWFMIDDRYDFQPTPATSEPDLQSALVVAAKPRTMEDLKVRYYQVAAATIILTHPQAQMTEAEFEVHDRMTKFNPERERRRKEIAAALSSRSPEEMKEEEILLAELKRISANEEKFLEDRKELYDRLDHPIAQHDIAAFHTSSGLQQLVTSLYYTDKNKKRKSIIVGETSSPAQAVSTPTTARDQRRDGPASATVDKRKGSALSALRTLTPAEEKRFGVSTHDRLNSGVSFRSSRVDKLVLAKSQAQSQKLQDAIREVSIPLRPGMPTIAICAEYEKLITSIHTLLDARKQCEKTINEIRIVKAQKGIGQEGESKDSGEVNKAEDDGDADGEVDDAAANHDSHQRNEDSEGEDNQEDESKIENDEENDGEENEAEDEDEPTKASIESDNEEADEDRPLMPGDVEDEEDEDDDGAEADAEAASVASPASPPADEDDDDDNEEEAVAEEEDEEEEEEEEGEEGEEDGPGEADEANHEVEVEVEAEEDEDEDEEELEQPSSSRASVARSTKSTRSGRSTAAGGASNTGNKHKRSASALSVSESEKSTGTRTSKRARK